MTASFRTIGFPDHLFSIQDGSFDLEPRQVASDTIFTSFVRAAGPVHMLWGCRLNLIDMEREAAQEFSSFRARVGGQVTLFTLRVPGHVLPLGAHAGFSESSPPYVITGTTILQGGSTGLVLETAPRYAQAIMIDFGAESAGDVVLKHGDKFGLGGNLYMSVAVVTADASGHARVPFRWKLWKGAAVGDIVSFQNPTCRVQLRQANDGLQELTPPYIAKAGFSAIEVPYV